MIWGWFNADTCEYAFVPKLWHLPFIIENDEMFGGDDVVLGMMKLKYHDQKYDYMADRGWIRFLEVSNNMLSFHKKCSPEQRKNIRKFGRLLDMKVVFV